MEIVLQYFEGCPNWTVAAERLALIQSERGNITLTNVLVQTPEEAATVGFRGSPSILVDGVDVFPDSQAEVGLACRMYATPDGFAGTPTLEDLRAAIARAEENHEPIQGALHER